jgi:polyketide synthase PksN
VRLALVVNTLEELKAKLKEVLENKPIAEGVYRGELKRNQETLAVFRADEELQEAIGKWIARGKIGKLAELWVQGLVVDWKALYGDNKPQRLSLPTYPFAQERYWVPENVSVARVPSGQLAQLHPLVHRNSSSLSEQRYSTTLNGEEFFLRDHVVQGRRIMPGVAQLEWARAAVSLALDGRSGIGLEQVSWLQPLVVESPLEVHIGLTEEDDGRISYEIYSDSGDGDDVVYSQGYGVVQPEREVPRVDWAALISQCGRRVSGTEIYRAFEVIGLEYGPSFQVLKELHLGDGLAVGKLELDAEFQQEGYHWLPNLLEGALQASIGVLSAELGLTLPIAVQAVEQWTDLPSVAWAVVRIAKGDSAGVRKVDVAIVDQEARVALELRTFSTRPLQELDSGEATETILAVPQWM